MRTTNGHGKMGKLAYGHTGRSIEDSRLYGAGQVTNDE